MICLTGDLHHQSLRTGNQLHSDVPELELAERFRQLARRRGIRLTYFVTGRAVAEEPARLRSIFADPLVEIGGHTYECFSPALPHRVWKKLGGSYTGPEWYERLDVARTIRVIGRHGRRVRVWRNHMYMHGPATHRILAQAGIEACSDRVVADDSSPRWTDEGILDVPINVIPDHEHLYHAERTREWVARWQRRYDWRDAFGPESYDIGTWKELVIERLRANERRGALSTLIIHPITMYLCDRFAAAEQLLDEIARIQTVQMSDVVDHARAQRLVLTAQQVLSNRPASAQGAHR